MLYGVTLYGSGGSIISPMPSEYACNVKLEEIVNNGKFHIEGQYGITVIVCREVGGYINGKRDSK